MRTPASIAVFVAFALAAGVANAATRTWTGAGSTSNLSEAANWEGGVVPGAGDNVILPGAPAKKALNNDIAGATFSEILVKDGAHYSIGGGALTLTPPSLTPTAIDLGVFPSVASELVFTAPVRFTDLVFLGGYGALTFRGQVFAENQISMETGVRFEAGIVAVHTIMLDATYAPGSIIYLGGTGSSFGGLVLHNINLQAAQGAIPDGTSLDVDANGVLDLGDVQVTTGDFACSGSIRINTGRGLVRVRGSGTLYHCNLDILTPSSTPAPINGEYTLIRDDGTAAMNVQYPNPVEGAPIVVNGAATTLTYHGGSGGRDVTLRASGASGASAVDVFTALASPFSVASGADSHFLFGASAEKTGVGPVQGAIVRFTAPPTCGTFNGAQSVDIATNASGYALVPQFSGGSPQFCTVTASLVGSTLSAPIPVVVYDPATMRLVASPAVINATPLQSVSPVSVTMLDAGQRPLINEDVEFQPGPGCGTFNPYGGYSLSKSSAAGVATAYDAYVAPAIQADCFIDVVTQEASFSTRIEVRVASGPLSFETQDMWWGGAQENGWGVSVIRHGGTSFAVIYAYDSAGKPTWYVMPNSTWNSVGNQISGEIYAPKGTPFFAYDASKFVPQAAVGSMAITFSDGQNAQLLAVLFGQAIVQKAIVRQPYGTAGLGPTGLTDMWWGGATQNGWGLAIEQHLSTIFGAWYTYDANGAPTWFVMPGGTWTSGDTYEGRMYRTTGSPWFQGTYSPQALQVFDVGPFKLRFNGTSATLDYSVEGRVGTLQLQKEAF